MLGGGSSPARDPLLQYCISCWYYLGLFECVDWMVGYRLFSNILNIFAARQKIGPNTTRSISPLMMKKDEKEKRVKQKDRRSKKLQVVRVRVRFTPKLMKISREKKTRFFCQVLLVCRKAAPCCLCYYYL